MGACCCCEEEPPNRREESRTYQFSSTPQRAFPGRPPVQRTACRHCGMVLDPAILDGHEERCNASRRQQATHDAQQPLPNKTVIFSQDLTEEEAAVIGNEDPTALCIICFERLRTYAFLPCGHLCACTTCTIPMSSCPICREPREGLLYVDPKANELCVCKHCKNVICPTFFDAHRETCAMRMRMARDGAAEATHSPRSVGGSATTSPVQHIEIDPVIPSTDIDIVQALLDRPSPDGSALPEDEPGSPPKFVCVDCRAGPRDIALIPCGHTCLCSTCAPSHTVCPVCCCDVKSQIRMFR